MTINTAAGAKLFIGTTAPISFPDDYDPFDTAQNAAVVAEFEADSYIEVGEIEDLGEFGDESERVKFTALSDARTRTLKGPRDAGEMGIVVGDDPTDQGQAALEAAEGETFDYNFRVQLNDAQTIGGEDSKHYFRGKVFSKRRAVGQANNVVRRRFTVGVNTVITSTDPS